MNYLIAQMKWMEWRTRTLGRTTDKSFDGQLKLIEHLKNIGNHLVGLQMNYLIAQMKWTEWRTRTLGRTTDESFDCPNKVNWMKNWWHNQWIKMVNFELGNAMWKAIDQHGMRVGQRKNPSPQQESNPWPPEHWVGTIHWANENSWRARSFNWVHMWQSSYKLLGSALSKSSWVW